MGSYLSMEATAAEFIRAVSCIFAGNDDGWWAQSGGFTGICGKKAVSRGAFVVMKPKVTAAYNTTRKTNKELFFYRTNLERLSGHPRLPSPLWNVQPNREKA
jgi:hypothetical protein